MKPINLSNHKLGLGIEFGYICKSVVIPKYLLSLTMNKSKKHPLAAIVKKIQQLNSELSYIKHSHDVFKLQ